MHLLQSSQCAPNHSLLAPSCHDGTLHFLSGRIAVGLHNVIGLVASCFTLVVSVMSLDDWVPRTACLPLFALPSVNSAQDVLGTNLSTSLATMAFNPSTSRLI